MSASFPAHSLTLTFTLAVRASAKRLLGDDRFGAVLHNPDFAIDSTNQRFKATPVRTCAASYLRSCVLTIHALTHSLSTFSLHSQAMDKLLAERRHIGKKSGSRKKR